MLPIVAITAPLRTEHNVTRVQLGIGYPRGVEHAGGVPVLVPPLARAADAARLMDAVDALLLTGGEDVDPAGYGAARHASVKSVSAERDAIEFALLHAAHERGKPVLAICRGIQLLNVAFGGSLVQDIPTQRPGALAHDQDEDRPTARVHDVNIVAGSILAGALGASTLRVNSFHHQAADRVADALRITASAPDGIVEGLEWRGEDWWAVAVQWHPEELDGPSDAGLFRAFVARAGVKR